MLDRTVTTACYGGNLGSWIFDGTDWSQPVFGQHLPEGTETLSHDAWQGRLLTFGGHHVSASDWHAELWQIEDGAATRLDSGSGAPAARIDHGIVFDSWRGRLMVFGGARWDSFGGHYVPFTQDNGDVHEWDGQTWHHQPSGTFPPQGDPRFRVHSAMAFDRARGRIVMFGGGSFPAQPYWPSWQNDTFEWDGTSWTAVPTATPPPAGNRARMHFDVDRQQCVLVIGHQLWSWDGADWTAQTIPAPPGGGLHYDAARGTYVAADLTDTWELHAGSWNAHLPSSGALAFDASQGRFAGSDDLGAFTYGDPTAASIAPFGDGCPGTAGTARMVGEDPPRIDRTIHMRLVDAPPAAMWFAMLGADTGSHLGQPLPIDLTTVGMPGCLLLTAIDTFELRGAPGWQVFVPNQPLLIGQRFTAQAFVFDASANPLGATTSAAIRLKVGGF